MKKLVNISLAVSFILSYSYAQEDTLEKRDRIPSVKKAIGQVGKIETKDVTIVDQFRHMFSDGKVSGQIRTVYAGYDLKENGQKDNYATAIGGALKYELASLYGFNGAVAFRTSQDLAFATGDIDDNKQNPELSSSKGKYTEVSEAYINYKHSGLNLRAGRQPLDTPLADSDDTRMIPNTFEAYVATYEIDDFSFMAGNIQKWQGVDAGLDDGWIDAGKNGTNFSGISYDDKLLEFSAWYYNITKGTNAFYADMGMNYDFNKNYSLHGAIQYLNESELDNSKIEADIYGALVEFVAYDIGFNLTYNKSNKKSAKSSFSGTGGGTMFTSMDTMILDEITEDRDASAVVAGMSYGYNDFDFLYAYGDFVGDKNSAGIKAHIVEQDIGFSYDIKEEFVVAAIYVMQEDKQNSIKTQNDWNRVQMMVNYNF